MVQKGHFPPIDPTKSLSRIGSRARSPPLHQVGNELRMDLAQHYDELQFGGAGSIRMSRAVEALKQDGEDTRTVGEQLCTLVGCLSQELMQVPPTSIIDKHHGFFPLVQRLAPELVAKVNAGNPIGDDDLAILNELCEQYKDAWAQRTIVRKKKK